VICLLIGYFFYGILNAYEVFGFFTAAILDFLPILAVVTAKYRDL
jgi:hypothetical protein